MANAKISALTDGTTAEATDKIPVERSGANRYITPGYIKTYLGIVGTLSVASGKTFTASNTLTLAGTDGTTMTFPGASGTVATLNANNTYTGVNTFQPGIDGQAGTFRRNSSGQSANIIDIQTEANASLAYVDKNGGIGANSIVLSGNISSAAWTTNGIRFRGAAATLTDTTSSGTVAAAYTNAYGGNTIAASSATTFTNYYTTFITAPTAGSNVTFTGRWALGLSGPAQIAAGTVTTNSTPALDITQTWNAGAVTFTGLKLNVTDTSSASASLLADLQVGGATVASIDKEGGFIGRRYRRGGASNGGIDINGSAVITCENGRVTLTSGTALGWNADTFIGRDGASNTLFLRNSTNAQTFRVYNTYTDASNYQRMAFGWNTSTALMMNEGAGTGADGSVAFNDAALATNATKGFLMIPSCAGAPTGTPADIPTGQIPIVFDSTNNKLYVYDGEWLSTVALT